MSYRDTLVSLITYIIIIGSCFLIRNALVPIPDNKPHNKPSKKIQTFQIPSPTYTHEEIIAEIESVDHYLFGGKSTTLVIENQKSMTFAGYNDLAIQEGHTYKIKYCIYRPNFIFSSNISESYLESVEDLIDDKPEKE